MHNKTTMVRMQNGNIEIDGRSVRHTRLDLIAECGIVQARASSHWPAVMWSYAVGV